MKITTEQKKELIEKLREERDTFAQVGTSTKAHESAIHYLETGEKNFTNDDIFKNQILDGVVFHPKQTHNFYCVEE